MLAHMCLPPPHSLRRHCNYKSCSSIGHTAPHLPLPSPTSYLLLQLTAHTLLMFLMRQRSHTPLLTPDVCSSCYNYGVVSSTDSYSWIGHQKWTHTKLIYHKTKRAATDPRTRTKSSRQGTSIGVGIHTVHFSIFWQVNIGKQMKNVLTKMYPCTVGFASSKTLVSRSQVLLRCLVLTAFFCVLATCLDQCASLKLVLTLICQYLRSN